MFIFLFECDWMRVCDYLLILDGFDGENSYDQLDGECLHVCVKRIGKKSVCLSVFWGGVTGACQTAKSLSYLGIWAKRASQTERAGEKEGGIEERRSNKREKQERRPWQAHSEKERQCVGLDSLQMILLITSDLKREEKSVTQEHCKGKSHWN